MNNQILMVDCDQTTFNTAILWHRDLELNTKLGIPYEEICHLYDFTPPYKEALRERGLTGMEFWKSSDLYDFVQPIEGSVETLAWASQYYKIVFASIIKGNHGSSKAECIKRHFPFQQGIYWTKEKGGVKHNVVIDDRLENINDCEDASLRILYDAGHEQYVEATQSHVIASNWQNVRRILESYV